MEVFKNHLRVYRNCIKVFDILYKFKITRYNFFYFYDSFFLTIKVVKKGYIEMKGLF